MNWLETNPPAGRLSWLTGQVCIPCNYSDISICSLISSGLACILLCLSYTSGIINTEQAPGNYMPCRESTLFQKAARKIHFL
jgi:hypothetical protein